MGKALQSLARRGLIYIERQSGPGTRIVLQDGTDLKSKHWVPGGALLWSLGTRPKEGGSAQQPRPWPQGTSPPAATGGALKKGWTALTIAVPTPLVDTLPHIAQALALDPADAASDMFQVGHKVFEDDVREAQAAASA